MAATIYINNNGKIVREDTAFISPNNRSFRYGDGCFETIKLIDGNLLLEHYHFERLFSSLSLLQFVLPTYFTPNFLRGQVVELVKKNNHTKLARIRLMVYRGDGGLYDQQNHHPNFLIQTWQLNPANNLLNENGLIIDVFKGSKKTCDDYSAIKSNNFLPYIMASLWVKKQQLNDAILLNPYQRVADASIANVFIIKDSVVKTSSLDEGGINGVMRRHLLKELPLLGVQTLETPITLSDVFEADEIFLTNCIYGIRWVKQCSDKEYGNLQTAMIYKRMFINHS